MHKEFIKYYFCVIYFRKNLHLISYDMLCTRRNGNVTHTVDVIIEAERCGWLSFNQYGILVKNVLI